MTEFCGELTLKCHFILRNQIGLFAYDSIYTIQENDSHKIENQNWRMLVTSFDFHCMDKIQFFTGTIPGVLFLLVNSMAVLVFAGLFNRDVCIWIYCVFCVYFGKNK